MKTEEKYVVFKKDQFELMMRVAGFTGWDETIVLKDAVVIRTQDIFAAAGLSAYEHTITQAMELIRVYDPRSVDTLGYEDLEKIRDYFRHVALEAEDRLARGECRLPD